MGISGGKDSAALAIYLRTTYPTLDVEYYFSDTGKELKETYDYLKNLESFLGKKILELRAAQNSPEEPFDHFLTLYGGFLPSPTARWCTRKLKLQPFEQYLGDVPTISYVAIRGDEDREGYISQKSNVQTLFPFRRNMWSKDVCQLLLANEHINGLAELYAQQIDEPRQAAILELIERPLSGDFNLQKKLNSLLDVSVTTFNRVMFEFLKKTDYPIGQLETFPLLDNEDVLVREDVFQLLDDSGLGKPKYYEPIEFEVDGQKGFYNRSRSGCYFCFFQQKIEWVWLYEKHRGLFDKAMEYEKDGFTWMEDERLEELSKAERIKQIKAQHIRQQAVTGPNKSKYLIDIISASEDEGCLACFM